jgi:hypothetical protein
MADAVPCHALLEGQPRAQNAARLPAFSRPSLGHFSYTRVDPGRKPNVRDQNGGGGGNRTAGDTPDSDDSRTVSRTGIDENTSKEHEQNALPEILMTMSQIPDVNLEFVQVSAVQAVFASVKRDEAKK